MNIVNNSKFRFFIYLILFVIFIFFVLFMYYNSEKEYTVKITETVVKNYNSDSKYLIFAEDSKQNMNVFEIEDTILYFRWNSSNLYGQLKVGQKYNIKVAGYRVEFLNLYQNIISAEKLE